MENTTSKKLACTVARILDDKKAIDIQILNISNISIVSDYFVIASGASPTQVKAMADSVRDDVKKYFSRLPIGYENDRKNRWNLLDYGDVIVHVMHLEERETYKLEKFWNHALKIDEKAWMEESKEFSRFE